MVTILRVHYTSFVYRQNSSQSHSTNTSRHTFDRNFQ